MKLPPQFRNATVLTAILAFAALALNFHDRAPDSLKTPNLTALSTRLQPLFADTKTVCFGQFVVEIPASATAVYGWSDVDYPIKYFPGEGAKVGQRVAEQLGEVKKDRKFLDKRTLNEFSLFGKVIDGVVEGQKLVFGSKDYATYSIDSFIPMGNDLFVQHATSAVDKDDSIKSLNTAASLLRLRAENEVPTEPGACIEGGFVAWRPEFERASIGVRLKEFPDVHFSIEVVKNQNYLVESSALEPRLKAAEKDGGSWYSGIKFFRRGPRELGHWNGSEALARKPAQGDSAESHQFVFISLGALHDSLQPSLDVQLDTGVRDDRTATVKPSITDEEAVALWDKLIGSIRVRPTGDAAKHSTASLPQTPLGDFIDTGSACPQAGWWQCSDHGEIAGGRRRHFVADEMMPHAVLVQKPSVLQKLTGQRPTHQIATMWQLVAYDPDETVASPQAGASTVQTDASHTNVSKRNDTQGPPHSSEG
jgi:hypothetical protein